MFSLSHGRDQADVFPANTLIRGTHMRDTQEGEWRMRRVLERIRDWRNYSGGEGGVKVPSKEDTLGSGSKSKDVQNF